MFVKFGKKIGTHVTDKFTNGVNNKFLKHFMIANEFIDKFKKKSIINKHIY